MKDIINDLLEDGQIMQTQVDRLLATGISLHLVLRDIIESRYMSLDKIITYIVQKIKEGDYPLL